MTAGEAHARKEQVAIEHVVRHFELGADRCELCPPLCPRCIGPIGCRAA